MKHTFNNLKNLQHQKANEFIIYLSYIYYLESNISNRWI